MVLNRRFIKLNLILIFPSLLQIPEIQPKNLPKSLYWCHFIYQGVEFNMYVVVQTRNHNMDVYLVYQDIARKKIEMFLAIWSSPAQNNSINSLRTKYEPLYQHISLHIYSKQTAVLKSREKNLQSAKLDIQYQSLSPN